LNTRDFLQHVQDAYAALTELSIIMLDLQHQPVTKVSNITELAELVLFSSDKPFPPSCYPNDYIQWRRPMVVQTGYWGVKAIIAPVLVDQKVEYWIWAGAFIEEETKPMIKEQCSQFPDSQTWLQVIEHAKEQTISAVEKKLNDIEKMAIICGEFISSNRQKQHYEQYFRLLDATVDRAQQLSLHMDDFLHMFQKIDPNIDFLLHIKRQDREWVVAQAVGEKAEQLGNKQIKTAFSPLSNSLFHSQNAVCFENAALDPRFAFFVKNGIKPSAVVAYPVLHNEKIEGWIVIGSQRKHSLPKEVVQIGAILVKYWQLYSKYELAHVKMDRHFMKLSMLIEIGRAMNIVKDTDEILRMMTDFIAELAYGDFVFTVLEEQKRKVKVHCGAISEQQVVEYYEDVCQRYFVAEEKLLGNMPRLCETKFGTVMEIPFSVHERMHGVMAVHMKHLEAAKEAEVYVTALIGIGTMVIERNTYQVPKQELNMDMLSERLTTREMDVLNLLVQGCSNREIADRLFISIHTVKNHITNIFQKIGVNDRSQLIALVYQLNNRKDINTGHH
jgi:DNA-binding CsgD family transcriptional regulator